MNIERAEIETVISVKVVKGDGTPENPVRAARLYFLANGTFIGEVDESTQKFTFPRKDRIKGTSTDYPKNFSNEDGIRKIVNEEMNHRQIDSMKATYPPELWQALQSEFPCLKLD